jgi:putative endopeptidase
MAKRLLKTDPHSNGKARINEQVKHQSGFTEAFSCKPGDKMSLPDNERVHIW